MNNSHQIIKGKLHKFLKEQAIEVVKGTNKKSNKQREQDMKAIEDFTLYIKDYEKNIKILEEYKQHQKELIDDGR